MIEARVPVSIVLIRPSGPAASVHLPGTHVVETSLEQLAIKPSALSTLRSLSIGAVILEDLRQADLPKTVRDLLAGLSEGTSCPVVSRWTHLSTGDVL